MAKEDVYLFLQQNKSSLNDKLGRLTTDLINIGCIPLDPVLIGSQTNWRLMSNSDACNMVSVNEQNLNYIAAYESDPTCTLAYLKHGGEVPQGLCQELRTVYEPFIYAWATHASTLKLQNLSVYEQHNFMTQYSKDLGMVENLAYQAVILAIGENISLLRGGTKKIEAHLAHAIKSLEEIQLCKSKKIPDLKEESATLDSVILACEKDLNSLNDKRFFFNELIVQSGEDLQQLYGKEDLFDLILKKESRLKGEQVLKQDIDKEIEEAVEFIKNLRLRKDMLSKRMGYYQQQVESEKKFSTIAKRVEHFKAQLQVEADYRKKFDEGEFLIQASKNLFDMLSNKKNSQLIFLQSSETGLKVNQQQLDVITAYYSAQLKEQHFYEPTKKEKLLLGFTSWLQENCRNGYDLAKSKLMIDGHQLVTGEFYCREVNLCINSNFLIDATSFLTILIGAFYVANKESLELMPPEIISYVKDIIDLKKLDKTPEEILRNSKTTLDNFIASPDELNLSSSEKSILQSMLKSSRLAANNARFFSVPHRPPVRDKSVQRVNNAP